MSIDSINELADSCRDWVRRCDDHAELAQVREILGGVMEEAWGRLRIPVRGIKAFEGRLDACAQWIEECDDDDQAAAARRMASERFRLPVSDFGSFVQRLDECEAWMDESELHVARDASERLSYWLTEVHDKFEQRELDESPGPPDEGTYPEWPSEPVGETTMEDAGDHVREAWGPAEPPDPGPEYWERVHISEEDRQLLVGYPPDPPGRPGGAPAPAREATPPSRGNFPDIDDDIPF